MGGKRKQEAKEQIFNKWTSTAAMCYERKMRCSGCINEEFCHKTHVGNVYNITPMKYSLLRIYANNGKQGLEKFLGCIIEEKTIIKE